MTRPGDGPPRLITDDDWTDEERIAMCQIALDAIKATVPVGITLEELNEALAAAGMRRLSGHKEWILVMQYSWEFRHCWDGTFSKDGRLNGPWPQIGERSFLDGYYYDRDGNAYEMPIGGEPFD